MSDFNALVEKYKKKNRYANSGTVTVQSSTKSKEEEEFWDLVEKYKSEDISNRVRSSDITSTVKKDDDITSRTRVWDKFEDEEKEEDIAPVKEEKQKLDFFQKGAFEDGYQFGDVTKAILGTVGDAGLNIAKGVAGIGEGLGDLVAYGVAGVADAVGNDRYAEGVRKRASVNLVDKMTKGADDYLNQYSVLGRTSDNVMQGVGQVGSILLTGGIGAAAGLGAAGTTALTTGVMGLSGMGSGMGEAYQGGATDEEALLYGTISGAADALTELMFGGLGKAVKATGLSTGLSSADDMLAKKVSSLFTNHLAKNLTSYGIKAGAEGFEEVVAGTAQALGKKLTYMSEEELGDLLKDENLLEQFVVGSVTSGLAQSGIVPGMSEGSLKESIKTGKDFITGFSQNEQAVIKKEFENRIAEQEKDGRKLTAKEKANIEAQVEKDMEKGYISTDTIEEVLGGDTYKSYRETIDSEDALQQEFDTLNKMKQGEMTGEQIDRRTELKEKLKETEEKSQRNQLKSKLGEEVFNLVQNDRLVESYNERTRRSQAFEADLSKYDEKQKVVVQRAIDSGILNNTNRTREFVDFVAKISADRGVLFDFANNAKLKESGFAVDGKTVNGYVTNDGITINIQSSKSLNSTVGHEIMHVLKGTALYNELQSALFKYAKTKGEYQGRYDTLSKLYKNIEGANIEEELGADLLGDYVFTDEEFINSLSTEHRNVFQKIYDEIKYLCKIATAGSKEARELEKVKHVLEKAWRENVQNQTEVETEENNFDTDDVKYSISVSDKETLDSLNEQVSRGEYDPDTNPNGGYYVTYKSMSFWGYDEDGNAILRSPMAEYVDGELSNAYLLPKDKSKLNWYQATETIDEATGFPSGLLVRTKKPGNKSYSYVPAAENQDLIQEDWGNLFFNLKKKVYKNGKWVDSDVPARYNPYEHSSNSMLNDQFSTAYLRDNLVTVKMIVPVSEDNGAFRAQWSKDPTGWTDWKTGTVAGKINKQKDLQRRVFLSRYAAPVEIVSDSEVAQAYKGYVDGTDVAIPDNVVSPNLLAELKKAGVPVSESGKVTPSNDDSVKVMDGGSVTKYSLSTWTPETQEKVRNNLTKAGFEKDRVDKWIKDTNSIASVIAADKSRLDFEAADNQTMLKNNQEYVKTLDASTLCAKRLVYQGTFDAIQHRMPNTVLTSDDLIDLLNMMKEKKVQTPCGVCYVESRRRHLGKFAQEWLDGYNGKYKPNLDEVTTSDGLEALRKSHPDTYDDFIKAMNKKGSSNPKVVQLRTEYRNEIMSLTPSQIRKIESIGGLRVQSFSDFETPHLLDMMQAVMDMTAKGLSSQAYTKVPNFAWVFGDTGIKINLSLIAEGNGFDADGNLAFSSVEGMDIDEAMKLRDAYSKNVGTIIVGANDQHILACMADDRIDYIIPFHRSGWGQRELGMMGMDGYTDYTYGQNEHSLETGKGVPNLYPPDYWDYNLSGKENAERYLNLCARTGREPKFSQFLVNNGDGSYSLQPDGSTDGYWKMLIDFKMYDNDGNGAAQQKVQPNFNMNEAYRVLGEYEGGANKLPVANDVVEEFVAKYNENVAPVKYSLSDSDGRQLSKEQQDYFKDSSIRDKDGNLMVLYHGTQNDFTVFDISRSGENYEGGWSEFGEGIYLTPDKKSAEYYGDNAGWGREVNLMEVYADIKNPFNTNDPVDFDISDLTQKYELTEFDERFMKKAGNRLIDFLKHHNESVRDYLTGKGFDGVWEKGIKGDVYQVVAYAENQIKNVDNAKPTNDPDIRYSLSDDDWDAADHAELPWETAVDNEGHRITYEQERFFKDSKIRDRNGNLRVVYHTTKNDFTVFDKSRKGEATDGANTFLGFFFAESPDHMEQFPEFQNGRTDAYYLDMKKPMDLTNLSKESFMDIVELTGGDRFEAAEAYDQELAAEKARARLRGDSNTALSISQLLYNMVGDYYHADFFDALKPNYDKLVAKGYDGVIDYLDEMMGEREFVVFDSNQAKLTTNTKPTDDPDIRHSFSYEGTEHPGYGSYNVYGKDVMLETAPVQETQLTGENSTPNSTVAPVTEDIAPIKEEPVPETETPKQGTRKELHEGIINNVKTLFKTKGFDFDKVLQKAKNLSTFATVDNTPQRVMEKALGYKQGQLLSEVTVNRVARNETEGIKWLNSFTDKKNGLIAKISKQYRIKPGSKESAAAQMYAEGFYVGENNEIIQYGDRELAMDFPDINVQRNIKGLAGDPRIRRIYDETLAAINASRTRNAYPEIPRLDNYFLHFRAMDDTFSRLGLPFNPNDIRAKDLPTDLNGVTADLKPGQPYFASAMHRNGKRTSFDLLGGLEKYLTSAKNQIYHIDDIQTLRALRNYIAETYGQASGLENLDTLSEEEAELRIKQVYDSHLSTFAKFLNEEANILAGKTALIDRGLEGIIGRRGITFLNTLNKQVGSNMVGFNVSSSLTNFLAPVQALAKTNKFDFVKAMAQTASNKIGSVFGKGDNFAEESPVMIRRKGAERFYRTPYQKVADAGYVMMGVVDDLSTELIARTKYNEFIRKGMSSNKAHYETDKWVSRLMGDRSLGQQPQLYNSQMLGMITKFQLEVRNQLDSQFYDTIQEAKVSTEEIQNGLLRNAKKAAKVTSTFAQLAVLQHLFGKAFESVAGYNPAFDIIDVLIKSFGWDDEEDDEDTVLDNLEEGFLTLLEDLPYTSTLTGGRIPISSALPITELIKGEDQYGNEKSRWETIGEVAPYYLLPGGYGQIKKTMAGLDMFRDEHPVAGSYTDSGNLRFPVEDNLKNRVQAGLFGQWASDTARDYFDNERKALNEKQIQEFIDVDLPIREYWQYREGLSGLETIEEKADYIAGLDLPVSKKNILVNNVTDRKEPIDLTDFDQYSSLEEMDFAKKNPEKYEIAQAVGGYHDYMTYKEDMKDMKLEEKVDYVAGLNLNTQQKNILINGEADRKEPIDLTGYENFSNFEQFEYAQKNPGKYAVSRAISDDFSVYYQINNEINDIKEKNDSSSGTQDKDLVKQYIFGLDLDYGQQAILFRSLYSSKSDKATYNYDICEYLNNRDDVTWEEMNAILLELGFDVDSEGNIYW